MSSESEQDSKQLAELIQQFLTHQVESNSNLNEAAKESLTVATECIEQAFDITRKPASTELLDMYRGSRQNQRVPPTPDPRELIQNLASTFINQVGSQFASAAANAATSAAQQQQAAPQPQQQQQHQPTTDAHQPPQHSAPPKQRKRASEAEKMAAESFKTRGNDCMKEEKYKEAYDCYTQAIEIDDNNAVYYCNRAAASAKLNDHQAALRDCEEALQIDPNYSKAYGRMGLAYASMENHQKAKEAYVKAVELDPTNESYRNNLTIAEEQLASPGADAGLGGLGGLGAGLGGLGAAAAGAAGAMPNMASMISNMMSNPAVMNMAMRSLQDPRVQNLFSGLASAATQGAAPQNPSPDQNNGQPR